MRDPGRRIGPIEHYTGYNPTHLWIFKSTYNLFSLILASFLAEILNISNNLHKFLQISAWLGFTFRCITQIYQQMTLKRCSHSWTSKTPVECLTFVERLSQHHLKLQPQKRAKRTHSISLGVTEKNDVSTYISWILSIECLLVLLIQYYILNQKFSFWEC